MGNEINDANNVSHGFRLEDMYRYGGGLGDRDDRFCSGSMVRQWMLQQSEIEREDDAEKGNLRLKDEFVPPPSEMSLKWNGLTLRFREPRALFSRLTERSSKAGMFLLRFNLPSLSLPPPQDGVPLTSSPFRLAE
jgi:hypothetical protein